MIRGNEVEYLFELPFDLGGTENDWTSNGVFHVDHPWVQILHGQNTVIVCWLTHIAIVGDVHFV